MFFHIIPEELNSRRACEKNAPEILREHDFSVSLKLKLGLLVK
jgi:hypothetical protein